MHGSLLRFLLIFCLFFTACQSGNRDSTAAANQGPKRFELLDPAQTGMSFNNSFNETGDNNYFKFNYAYIGGAVGVGDFNNDGLQDIYMVATMGENKLFINR
jgi:hypothetical protein